MNRIFLSITAVAITAAPAMAASKNPFSADFWKPSNTDLIVLVSFILFVGVLIYLKVPGLLGRLLDERAAGIKSELDEARALKEEAQALLASYERKQAEVQEQADRIVAQAKSDAQAAAEQAKLDLKASIARRMAAAEDQITSAEASAVKDVRDRAISVAVMAARDVIAKELSASDANKLIDDAISEVDTRMH
jgi:F-type H+-transporting ATPase subunit b